MIYVLIILGIVLTHAGVYIFGFHGGLRRGAVEGRRAAAIETQRLSRYLEKRSEQT